MITMQESASRINQKVLWTGLALLVFLLMTLSIIDAEWIYMGLAAAPLIFYICLKNPFIVPFGLYVFSLPFENLLVLSGHFEGATLTKMLGIASIFFLILKGLFEKRLKVPDKAVLWWVLFALYCFLSTSWAISPESPAARIQTITGLVALYLAVSLYRIEKKEYDALMAFILLSGIVCALLTVYSYKMQLLQFGSVERASLLTLKDENGVWGANKQGFDMLLPFAVCLGALLKQKKTLMKFLLFAAFLLIFYSIILTGSRGDLFGCLAILIILALTLKNKVKFTIITVLTVMALFSVTPHFFIKRINNSEASHAEGRTDIWLVGAKAAQKYWLFGAGLDSFPQAYTQFAFSANVYMYRGLYRAPHNIFVGNFVELGVIGTSFMIMGFLTHFLALKQKRHKRRRNIDRTIFGAALAGVLISSLALDCLWYKTFWLLLAMIIMQKNIPEGWREQPELKKQEQIDRVAGRLIPAVNVIGTGGTK